MLRFFTQENQHFSLEIRICLVRFYDEAEEVPGEDAA